MTHRFIDYFTERAAKLGSLTSEDCIFCSIIARVEPGWIVYETEHVLAFLDVLPITSGHTLVVPKRHYVRTDEMPEEIGAMMGAALMKVSKAVSKAISPDYNIVNNNGRSAGQVVHHVHYHIVPAATDKQRWRKPSKAPYFGFGLGTRYQLDESEAEEVAARIRRALDAPKL